MDPIENLAETATPAEKARGRIAITLYATCLLVCAIWLLIDGGTKRQKDAYDFANENLRRWSEIEARRIDIEGGGSQYFQEQIHTALAHTCVSAEMLAPFAEDIRAHRTLYYSANLEELSLEDCQRQNLVGIPGALTAWSERLARNFQKAAENGRIGNWDAFLEKVLRSPEFDPNHRIFFSKVLAAIHRGTSFDALFTWPVQRQWLLDKSTLWSKKSSEGFGKFRPLSTTKRDVFFASPRAAPLPVSGDRYPSSNPNERPFSRLSDRGSVDRADGFQESSLQLERLGLAARKDVSDVVDKGLSAARGLRDLHEASMSGRQLQFAGVSLGLLDAMEVALPIVAALSILLVIYHERTRVAELSGGIEFRHGIEWFPRLGSPLDPLAGPLPSRFEDWLSRGVWLLFLSLPPAVGYFVAWYGMNADNAASLMASLGGSDRLAWVNALLFMVIWIVMVRITRLLSPTTGAIRSWLLPATFVACAAYFLGGLAIFRAYADDPDAMYHINVWLLVSVWAVCAFLRTTVSRFAIAASFALLIAATSTIGALFLRGWREVIGW